MIAASAGTVLLALASREAKLGLIFLDMRRAVEDLRKVV